MDAAIGEDAGVEAAASSDANASAETSATDSGLTDGSATDGSRTDAGIDGAASEITVYVTPSTSLTGSIVAAIEGATTSIHVTAYVLDSSPIVTALVNQKKAGLDVRVVLNQTFPTGTVQTNPTTYSTLTAAGVGVVWRNGPPGAASGAYTEESTLILDGTEAWITTTQLDASSTLYNREYVAVDENAADVSEADQIFLADYAGTANTSGSPLVVSPGPPGNARTSLVALIGAATTTLDVEVETLSDNATDGVVAAIAAAAKRGVVTRVILANVPPPSAETTAIATVKAAGGKVVLSGKMSGTSTPSDPFLHGQAITLDCTGTTCARGYVGSGELTAASLQYNRNLGVVFTDAAALAKIESTLITDFSEGVMQ